MRILCIGDVVGGVGCRFLRAKLPALKRVKGVDLTVCNGENSADGNGLTDPPTFPTELPQGAGSSISTWAGALSPSST